MKFLEGLFNGGMNLSKVDMSKRTLILGGGSLALVGALGLYKLSGASDDIKLPKYYSDYWDGNRGFHAKGYKFERVKYGSFELIEDARLTFYVLSDSDFMEKEYFTTKTHKGKKIKIRNTKKVVDFDKVRSNLVKLNKFKYLESDEYDRTDSSNKILSFNVPDNVKPGMYIPIPIDSNHRELTIEQFGYYCLEAIDEMMKHSIYGTNISELVNKVGRKKLLYAMIAFARSESTADYKFFKEPIGSVELHRWEKVYQSFSFTYYHILMEKNADGNSGPGLTARKKLGFTEGQTYHPKYASMLFLAYWIEKKSGNLNGIFPLTSSNYTKVGTIYNGSSSYGPKLWANYNHISSRLSKFS